MHTRKTFQKLAQTRLKEVKLLKTNKHYDSAAYLAGYVIELALKARICKILKSNYPNKSGNIQKAYFTHNFDELLYLSALENEFDKDKIDKTDLNANWSLVTGWSESWRYNPIGTKTKAEVEEIILALEDPTFGIFTWIKKRW